MGDAAGIGPEITLKALADENLRTICQPLIIGDLTVLRKTAAGLNLNYELTDSSEEVSTDPAQVAVCDLKNLAGDVIFGEESAAAGAAAAEYIETAVRLWQEKKIDAIATAPISY